MHATGIDLVLLPGLDGSGRMFDALRSRLDPAIRVTVISYPREPAYGYHALETLVRRGLPQNRPYILFAESFSGPIAVRLAASKPAGLVGMILCSTFVTPPRRLLRWLRPLMRDIARVSIRLSGPAAAFLLPNAERKDRDELARILRLLPAETVEARLLAVAGVDVRSELALCTLPLLLMRGSRDRLLGGRSMRQIRSIVPGSDIVIIDAPHLIVQNNPSDSASTILRFIVSLDQSEPAGA